MFKIVIQGKTVSELQSNLSSIASAYLKSEDKKPDYAEMYDSVSDVVANFNSEAAEEIINNVIEKEATEPGKNFELDAENLPWDARIHASTKTLTTKGVWKQRKGVDPKVLSQVKNELYNRGEDVLAQQHAVVPEPYIAPAQPTQQQVVAQQPATIPQPSFNNAGHTLETFKANFLMIIGNLVTQGKLDQAYLNSLLQYFKVAQLWEISDAQKAEMFENFAQANLIQRAG